jgi:hypothetical protein
VADLRLEPQLGLGVAALVAAGGDERVVRAALVVVDPVDVLVLRVAEREDGAEDALAVAAVLQRLGDDVDPDHEILEVLVREHHPAVAEAVVGAIHARAGVVPRAAEDLLHVGHDRLEVRGRERLEHDRRPAGALEPERHLERDRGGRHREQPALGRRLDLPLARQDVEQAHQAVPCSCISRRWSAAIRFSIGGCVANSPPIALPTGGKK